MTAQSFRRALTSVSRLAAVAFGFVALLGAAERTAWACMQPLPSCKLEFAPAAGKQVPSNVASIAIGSTYGIRSVELRGPYDAPVAITMEEQAGLFLLKPQEPLAPGRHRIVAMVEQPGSCTGAADPTGELGASDGGTEPSTALVRYESTFAVGAIQAAPTTAGTVAIGEPATARIGDTVGPVFEYPVQIAVAPEMRPYLPVARWTLEVDGSPKTTGTTGDEGRSFGVPVLCGKQAPSSSCAGPAVLPPGPHKVRAVARIMGAETPIATSEIVADFSCETATTSAADTASSDGGCDVTRRSTDAGAGVALLGVAGLVARLRRRSRRRSTRA